MDSDRYTHRGHDEDDPLSLFESESSLHTESAAAPPSVHEPVPVSSASVSLSEPREPRIDSHVPAVAVRTSSFDTDRLTLDEVLGRLGHIEWTEATAIALALCRALVGNERESTPKMSQIALTSSGEVVVSAGGGRGVATIARMIHALTVAGSVPPQLRLLVTKWAAADSDRPLGEFAAELSFFERPGGQALVRGVYERANALQPVRTETRPVPAVQLKKIDEPPAQKQPIPRLAQLAALAGRSPRAFQAAVLVLATSVALAMVLSPGEPELSPAPVPEVPQVPSVQDLASIGAIVPGGRIDSDLVLASAPLAATPPRADSTTRIQRAPTTRPATTSAGIAPRGSSNAIPPVQNGVAPAPEGPLTQTAAAVAPAATAPPRVDNPNAIYSSSDTDVTPPVLRFSQLPTQFLSGIKPEMNTMELVVSATGAVERVRLISTPKRMPDMMLLSGAKSWEFEPASKDGRAVRYRLELSWTATP